MQPERADMNKDLGASANAEPGSRASTEPSSTVSALTGFDPARLSPSERKAIVALSSPLHPREFAHQMWPDSPCWQNRTNCGRGVSTGGGMRLAAGGMLGKLRRKYPELFVWHVRSGSATGLTALGHEVRRAIAIEARQRTDPEGGLDPKGESAGPQDIAQGPSQ